MAHGGYSTNCFINPEVSGLSEGSRDARLSLGFSGIEKLVIEFYDERISFN